MDHIEIVPYDPQWPGLYEIEAGRLRSVLDSRNVIDIEHFGSTAVPGLAAKPIIDILIAVQSLSEALATFVDALRELDYVFWAENPKSDRLFFVKGMPPYGSQRTHHVHVTEPDGELWGQRAFRDYLRTHPEEAGRYERLKRDFANRFRNDREAYTDAKATYIAAIQAKANSR